MIKLTLGDKVSSVVVYIPPFEASCSHFVQNLFRMWTGCYLELCLALFICVFTVKQLDVKICILLSCH